MVHTTIDEIRDTTGITSTTISDDDMTTIMNQAISEVNRMINVKVVREYVDYLDRIRQNKRNGTNATYYIKNWKGKYFGDRNDDGSISTSDVIVYLVDESAETETLATVSSIDYDDGKIILSSAPTSTQFVYITYDYTFYDIETPDKMIKLLTTYLASAYATLRAEHGLSSSVKFGNISISNASKDKSYNQFYDRYLTLLKQINTYGNLQDNWAESKVKI